MTVKRKLNAVQKMLHKGKSRTLANGVTRIVRDNYHTTTKTWWQWCKEILERDGHRCRRMIKQPNGTLQRCPNSAAGGWRLEVHHIKELSHGGKTISANLLTLCTSCHDKKHKHEIRR